MMDLENMTVGDIVARMLDSPLETVAVSLSIASLGYLVMKGVHSVFSKDRMADSYPPGPPRDPLIGAVRSFPKDHFYDRLVEWAALYGDIVYAPIPGMNMVIINSYEVAQEFLSKRPNTTAGRRIAYIITDLMKFGWSTAFIQPGPSHSNQRKMLRRGIGPQRVGSYDPTIESEVAKFMQELVSFEGHPYLTVQLLIGRMVSKFTYGEKIWDEMGDGLSHWNLEVMDLINEAFFGVWLVEFFHFLRFIPDWVPGLRFKQLTRMGSELSDKVRYLPYKRGLELYKAGTLGHCILNDLLEEFGESGDVQDALAVLYSGASETTSGAIVGFLLVLWLYPEVSQRVFDEIQSLTHGQRLPKVVDRPSLPYTEAVFKESIRIRPFIPLGVPHVNTQDEILRGYLIPKGTMIHQCPGIMFQDARVWKDPDVFRPERFLEPEASQRPNPLTMLFGYGIRVCPGMWIADRLAFHIVATTVSLFHILPLEGKTLPDPKKIEWSDTAIQQPLGFECRFVVRDEKAQQLLKTVSLHE
ncbi:cytochrome P450 [Serendipita vermifera]|nr:cytochrome P450 [Serendipita vermifera]